MKDTTYDEKLTAWMAAVITNPEGVYSGAKIPTVQRLLEKPIDEVIKPSKRLTSGERLSIYHRAYYARLLACFQAEYPGLQALLGEDLFKVFTFDYLQKHPSRSYTLNELGAQFPSYLAQTQPERKTSNSQEDNWIDLILELAQLERAYTEVYDGPGHENDSLPNADAILRLDRTTFENTHFVAANCLRLFAFQYPVHECLIAARKGKLVDRYQEPKSTFIALHRNKYVLRFIKLSQLDYQLLQAIFDGATIREALLQVTPNLKQQPEASPMNVRSRICNLADEGFFKKIVS